MTYKLLACTAALTFAFSASAFAQDKSATKPSEETPKTETKAAGPLALGLGAIIAVGAANEEGDVDVKTPDAQVMGSGSGAGKASFKDLSVVRDSGGEDRLTENVLVKDGGGGGKVAVQDLMVTKSAQDPKLGPIKGESQDRAMSPNDVDIDVGDVQPQRAEGGLFALGAGLSGDAIAGVKDPKLGDIEGESVDRAQSDGFVPLAGTALGVKSPACVTEDGAVDADCNGVADDAATAIDRRDIRKRPEPRQQRR